MNLRQLIGSGNGVINIQVNEEDISKKKYHFFITVKILSGHTAGSMDIYHRNVDSGVYLKISQHEDEYKITFNDEALQREVFCPASHFRFIYTGVDRCIVEITINGASL